MNTLLTLLIIYAYMHYGTMAFLCGIGYYKGKKYILFRDLIPFRWVWTTYTDIFKSNRKFF